MSTSPRGNRRSIALARGLLAAGVIAVAATSAAGAAGISGGQNTRRVTAQLTYTNSNIREKACAGGFDLSAGARIHLQSPDPDMAGTIVGHFNEVANSADDAYLIGHGTFLSRSGKHGNVTLIAVDHGNDLNGVYLIRLAHQRGVIVANTASHQDRFPGTPSAPAGGHGEIGTDQPLRPHNYAVLATASCSGSLP